MGVRRRSGGVRFIDDYRLAKSFVILPLYAQRMGCIAIAKQIGLSRNFVKSVLIERGVYQPGALKSLYGGPCSRHKSRQPLSKQLCGTLYRMRQRVAGCLSRRPTRTKRWLGISKAEVFKSRYHNDPSFRCYQLCRRRMKRLLNGIRKAGKSTELLGCTTDHLRAHIASQFKQGMTWNNAGTGRGKWHIDHIIPGAAFDLTRDDQQRICFNWTNLRPMWSIANIRKGKRLPNNSTPCMPM